MYLKVLAYQKDLQDYRTNLQQTEACLKETRERFFNLEEETDGLKMKCDVLEEERYEQPFKLIHLSGVTRLIRIIRFWFFFISFSIRLKENCAKSNASINDFKDVKDNLTRKVMELNFLLEEVSKH